MSKIDESVGFYRKMSDLQEKLRRSEEERLQLEEKFTLLMRACRDEEEARLNNLRERYENFLDEEKQRRERNDRILQTLDRIESRAAVLTAKSERLRLLRKHYEAYMLRVYPGWKYINNRVIETQPAIQKFDSQYSVHSEAEKNLPFNSITSSPAFFQSELINAGHAPTVLQNYAVSGINPTIKQPFPSPGIVPSLSPYHPVMGTAPVMNHLHPTAAVSQSYSVSDMILLANQTHSPIDIHKRANSGAAPATQNPFTTMGVLPTGTHQHTVPVPGALIPPQYPYTATGVYPTVPTTSSATNTPITTFHPVTSHSVLATITQQYPVSEIPSMSGFPVSTPYPFTTTSVHPAISQPNAVSGITSILGPPLTRAADDASTFKVTRPPQESNIQEITSQKQPLGSAVDRFAADKGVTSGGVETTNRIGQIDGHLGRAAEMLKMSGVANELKDKSLNENLNQVHFQNLKDNKHFQNSLDLELEQNTSGDILNVTLSDDGILQDEPIICPSEIADEKQDIQSSTKDQHPRVVDVSNVSGQKDESGDGDMENVKAESVKKEERNAKFVGGGDSTISTESSKEVEDRHNVAQDKSLIPALEEKSNGRVGVAEESKKGAGLEGEQTNVQVSQEKAEISGEGLPQDQPIVEGEQQYAQGQQWDQNNPEYYQEYGQQDDQYYQYAEGEYDQQQYAEGSYDQQQYAEGAYDQQQYAEGEYDAQYAEQYGMYDQQYPQYTEEEYQAYQQHEAEKALAAAQAQDGGQTQESTEEKIEIHGGDVQEVTSSGENKVEDHSRLEENLPDKVQGENDTKQGERVQNPEDDTSEKADSSKESEVPQVVVLPKEPEVPSDATEPSSSENVAQYRQLLGVPPSGETETSETDELEAELAALVNPEHDGDVHHKQSLKPSISEDKTTKPKQDPDTSTTSESNVPVPTEPKKGETKISETAESEKKTPDEPSMLPNQKSKPAESETKTSQPSANRPVSKKLPDLNKMLESDSESLQLDATVSNAESDDFELSSEK